MSFDGVVLLELTVCWAHTLFFHELNLFSDLLQDLFVELDFNVSWTRKKFLKCWSEHVDAEKIPK